jgi:hypothetical protein
MAKPPMMRPPRMPKSPMVANPAKAVKPPPKMRPTSTRNYGKGGTPLSGAPDMGQRGAGIGVGPMGPDMDEDGM